MVTGPSEIEKLSGVSQPLTPEQDQIVDGETQLRTLAPATVVEIAEPEKRIPPIPGGIVTPGYQSAPEAAPIFPPGAPATGEVAWPVLLVNRYTGTDQTWQMIVRWQIPTGYMGDVHEISVLSDNDSKTRYRVILGDVDQQLPTDRAMSTPVAFPWRATGIAGPRTVSVECRSTDGTSITVDAMITGTVRSLP